MIVIGAGRVGTALAQLGGERVQLIDRERGWQHLERPAGEPIVLCVRNDDLAAVLARVPAARRDDLVFVQNGMLRPFLAEQGLAAATRGLLFFAVSRRGAAPEPGGDSPFCGPRAREVVAAFTEFGLAAREVSPPAFAAVELEKLIWNSAFGLCCEAFACNVGTVVRDHRECLDALLAELLAVGGPPLGLVGEQTLDEAALGERLRSYSLAIAGYRGAVKEWPWRNGWFVAQARTQGRATPVHDRLLREVGRGPEGASTSRA